MAKRIDGDGPLEDELDDFEEEGELLDEEEEEEDEDADEEAEEDGEEEDDEDEDELVRAAEEDDDGEEPEPIFTEEAGYSEDFDWSSMPEADRKRHESIIAYDREQLEDLNYKRLSVFDRWAAAQALARYEMREQFHDACRSILRSRRRHEGLAYEDIYLELISDLAEAKEFDEAFALLDKFRKAFDEEDIYQRVRGLLLIESGQIHDGRSLLKSLMDDAGDHGELHLEIGDDLLAMGHPELALGILTQGKTFARRNKDTELLSAFDETIRLANTALDAED